MTHDYPEVGKDIGAIPVLKKIIDEGHRFILLTMRSDEPLSDAVQWFQSNQIPLFAVNENPEQKTWTNSPKVYGSAQIDDAAVGTPLRWDTKLSRRPFVDWEKMTYELIKRGILPDESHEVGGGDQN